MNALIARPVVPDIVGQMSRGNALGVQMRGQRAQNALAQSVQQSGPMSPQAMNALAGVNPQGAMEMQTQREQFDQRLGQDASQFDRRLELSEKQFQAEQEIQRQRLALSRAASARAASASARAQASDNRSQVNERRQRLGAMVAAITQLPPDQQARAYAETYEFAGQIGADLSQVPTPDRYTPQIGIAIASGLLGEPVSQPQAPRPTALEQQVQMLIASGVEPERAMGIAAGRFGLGDDMYGASQVIDRAAPTQETAQVTQQTEMPETIDPGYDAEQAFGITQQLGRAANVLTDAFGLGLAAPEAETAARNLNIFREGIKRNIVSAYGSRPSNYLLQSIDKNVPDPDAWLEGRAGAETGFRALNRDLGTEENALQRRLNSPIRGNDRIETEQQLDTIRQTRAQINGILQTFDDQDGPVQQNGGFPDWMLNTDPSKWTDEQFKEAEEAGFLDG